jgi:hypothetical protein
VETFWRGSTRAAHEEESYNLETQLLELMKSESQPHRLAGIAAVTALLTGTTNEAFKSRLLRTGLALTTLEMYPIVKYGDVETSEASTELLLAFSKEKGLDVRRFVSSSLQKALADLVEPQNFGPDVLPSYFKARMVRNCMIVTKIGPLFPNEVVKDISITAQAVAKLVSNKLVTDYAVPCVVAIMSTCANLWKKEGLPGTRSHCIYIAYDEVREFIWKSLNDNLLRPASTPARDISKVLGSVVLIGNLLSCEALVPFLGSVDIESGANHTFYFELGVYLLDYKRCPNVKVQSALAVGLTNLAKFEPATFCRSLSKQQSFAKQAFDFFFERAGNVTLGSVARADAIRAAGDMAVTIESKGFSPYLEKALCLCSDLLSELLRGSRHREGRAVEKSIKSRPAAIATESASPPLSAVLDFVRCVSCATTPGDPAYVAKCKSLLGKMFKFDVSIALTDALRKVMAVVTEKHAYIQNVVMRKVESVFVDALASSGDEIADSEEGLSAEATGRGSMPGAISDNISRLVGHQRPGTSLDKLFIPRSPANVEPGYVTALSGLQRHVGGTQTDFQTQDVVFDLELLMDPTLRQVSPNWSSSNKASPRMALNILASFDFSTVAGNRLAWFANQYVVSFLEVPSIVDRRLAVRAIANLMKFAAGQQSDSFGLRDKIFMVISQLVSVAVVDPSRRVRLTCLVAINEPYFELFLAQPEILPCLGQCLQDEDIGVRGQALKIVCRLHRHNCAEADPILRRFFYHLMSVLQCPSEAFTGVRAQASRLLQMLIRDCSGFMELYWAATADVLLMCLKKQLAIVAKVDSSATLPIIEAIGDLSNIVSVVLEPAYVRTLVPLLVTAVLDVETTTSHLEFRVASLRALTRVVQITSLRFKPQDIDARLLASLVSNLKAETDANVRIETLQLLGAIGAVDPDRDEIKYVALPSTHTASTSPIVGAQVLYRLSDGQVVHGVPGLQPGSVIAVNSQASATAQVQVEGQSTAVGGDFGGDGAGEAGVAADGTIEPARGGGKSSAQAMPIPPLVSNAARGVDFHWMETVISRGVPVWRQPSLRTDSLVNILDHPYTDSELYFPSVVLDVLHGVVGHARHAPLHLTAVGCIVLVTGVIKNANKCNYFLPSIVPRLLWMLQPVDPEGRLPLSSQLEQLFLALADLVAVVKSDFEDFLPDTIALCFAYMTDDDVAYRLSAVGPIAVLLKVLAREIGPSFRPYAAHLMGALVSAMMLDTTPECSVTSSVLSTIVAFGDLFAQYSCVVLPAMIAVAENTRASPPVRLQACTALESVLSLYANVPDLAASVLHPLIRILATADIHMLRDEDTATFCFARAVSRAIRVVALKASAEFSLFVPVVAKALRSSGMPRDFFEANGLEAVLLESNFDVASGILGYSVEGPTANEFIASLNAHFERGLSGIEARVATNEGHPSEGEVVPLQLDMDIPVLLKAFEISEDAQAAEWTEWMDNLAVALLQASVAPAMRAVWRVGEQHPPLARQLFNAAFLSCWSKLETLDPLQLDRILGGIKSALESKSIPLHTKQTLLDLCEFMDHGERPLPISSDILTEAAVAVGAFAKALRHKETDYISCQSTEDYVKAVASGVGLIEIYNNLGHKVSAAGTLEDFSERVEDKDIVREVELQYDETLTALPEVLERYQKEAAGLRDDIDLSTVVVESESRGRELFTKARIPIPSDTTSRAPTTREALPDDERDLAWFLTLSQLRILDSLGEWQHMEDMAQVVWTQTSGNKVAQESLAIQGRACSVAFDLSSDSTILRRFRERVDALQDTGNWDEPFYKTLLCIRRGGDEDRVNLELLDSAMTEISKARDFLDTGLRSRAAEGYPRAYGDFLNAQHLVELEEMVECMRAGRPASGIKRIKTLWDVRLNEARGDLRTWYRLLMIRSLLLDPSENQEHWLKFAAKCRKYRRLPMATEALRKLLRHLVDKSRAGAESGNESHASLDLVEELVSFNDNKLPDVNEWRTASIVAIPDRALQFACIKHMWAAEKYEGAFQALKECTMSSFAAASDSPPPSSTSSATLSGRDDELQAEIFLKLAKWSDRIVSQPNKFESVPGLSSPEESLYYAKKATEWRPLWFKAWHFWASLNAIEAKQAVDKLEEQAGVNSNKCASGLVLDIDAKRPPMSDRIVAQIACAIDGFFNAIGYGGKTGLEDVLTLLTLWFKHGSHPKLSQVFMYGFDRSEPEKWLEVVPQIIARLHTTEQLLRNGIERLLTLIGLAHPHAAVYPLTVAANTPGGTVAQDDRRKSAKKVLSRMRKSHEDIVDQAAMLATELNRVAILEHELWYDRIEEASRLYYSERNVTAMLETLRPLHEEMAKGEAVTECEKQFRTSYGSDLRAADDLGQEYLVGKRALKISGHSDPQEEARLQSLIERAWEFYYQVFRRIQRQQSEMRALDLKNVSPVLAQRKKFGLTIPGSYRPRDKNPVILSCFEPSLDVIQSKQRPRKLCMLGNDGKRYKFLLKGHDDLRQDERVMQVFGLMNQHLAQSEERSVRKGAEIKRYNVVVLSSNAGLIEWVPECDTMHALVKTFRENRKVIPNVEHKVMLRVAPEPERLTLLQRVDLFQFMLQNTGGRDIARVLWLRSRNSEMWLDTRTNFARTLATTSIAGYVLGLGDRHPSNIMIEKYTGKVMHIDFGDCFEIAMQREKYPETVPFRLTRMLVHALEPCGTGGHFRHMAVGIMRVLRKTKTRAAVLSMMDAFVCDPLIRQRLLDGAELTQAVENNPDAAAPSSRIAERYMETQSLAAISARDNGLPDVSALEVSPSQRSRSLRANAIAREGGVISKHFAELADRRAEGAISRVLDKLTGKDFDDTDKVLTPEEQVDRLIEQATNVENLCVLFNGYVSCW